jgi:hypothetical protein
MAENQLDDALFVWIQNVVVRLDALERVVHEHSGITPEQIQNSLQKSLDILKPPGPVPVDGYRSGAMNLFLSRAVKPLKGSG